MSTTDDSIAATIILVLSATAFSAYLIILFAITMICKEGKNAFYYLLLALGISDEIMLGLFLFYSTPATFLQRQPLGYTFDSVFCGTLCNLTYFAGLALSLNIAANRYFSVCSKSIKNYDRRKILITIVACYGFGLVSAIAQMTPCCSLRYYEGDYDWSYDMTLDGNTIFVWYDRMMNSLTFGCLVCFYGLIFSKVRKTMNTVHPISTSTSEARRSQRIEVHLALQSGLVAGLMIVFGLGFTIIPLITENKWWHLMSSVLYIGAVGVHPFVYIACNQQIRKQTGRILKCQWNERETGQFDMSPGELGGCFPE